ncbi:MAG: zinc-binding dehydrogenase [Bacteroidales bacterium]|nr:zinc-binding dehydrogenase [Bacteroidales bacterium]
MTSKIFELDGPKNLYLRNEEINPDQIEDDEIIAETIYSAISPGTEVAAYRGANPLREGQIYPRVLGYCNVAKIIKTGKNISQFSCGDHIFTHQSHRTLFKIKPNKELIIKLNDDINLKHAAISYLYHLGYHSLISADAKSAHNLGVVGVGTLGYSTCIMSHLLGAKTFAFSNQTDIRKRLKEKGVFCFEKSNSSTSEINNITHGAGLDIIINTSNNWDDWMLALNLVNKGGTIINLGFPGRDEPIPPFNPLDPKFVYAKNIIIKPLCCLGEFDNPYYFSRFSVKMNLLYILDLIKEGKLNPEELISQEINYKELKAQYEKYLIKNRTLFSTIINWL